MSRVELLLDVLRMAQLQEDEIRKHERSELEKAVDGFRALLRPSSAFEAPISADLPHSRPRARTHPVGDGVGEGASGVDPSGWRAAALGEWGERRVSEIVRLGGGDGSDFALVLAALVHAVGARVRLSVPPHRRIGTSPHRHIAASARHPLTTSPPTLTQVACAPLTAAEASAERLSSPEPRVSYRRLGLALWPRRARRQPSLPAPLLPLRPHQVHSSH
jgi:hypothetical protein